MFELPKPGDKVRVTIEATVAGVMEQKTTAGHPWVMLTYGTYTEGGRSSYWAAELPTEQLDVFTDIEVLS